jgi:hypothetical protein
MLTEQMGFVQNLTVGKSILWMFGRAGRLIIRHSRIVSVGIRRMGSGKA